MSIASLFFRYASLHNDEIDLCLSRYDLYDEESGINGGYLYYIYRRHSFKKIGYISLRLGESPGLYYLGHIGYRIEAPFRGHHYALQACRLLLSVIRQENLKSVVITTDVDNVPSRKTCEKLGCVLESIVPVPDEFRVMCSGSTAKCRYILFPFGREK